MIGSWWDELSQRERLMLGVLGVDASLDEGREGALEDVTLVREVLIQRGPGHPGRLCDVDHRGPGEAALGEHVDRGGRDRRARRVVVRSVQWG